MQSLQLSWVLLMLIIGAAASVAGYLSFRVPRQSSKADPESLEEFAVGIRMARGRIPVVLWLLFIGMACFLIGYVLYVRSALPNF
jgi:hypothetical protein